MEIINVFAKLYSLEIIEMALSAIKKYLSYFTKKLINKHVRPCHATWLAHITVEKQDPILADHFLTKLKRYGFSGQKLLISTNFTIFSTVNHN